MSDWNLELPTARNKKRGVIEQREHIPAKPKKVAKPWVVTWSWKRSRDLAILPKRRSRAFATEEQARRFMEKELRSYGMHPHTAKAWGPTDYRITGPDGQEIKS